MEKIKKIFQSIVTLLFGSLLTLSFLITIVFVISNYIIDPIEVEVVGTSRYQKVSRRGIRHNHSHCTVLLPSGKTDRIRNEYGYKEGDVAVIIYNDLFAKIDLITVLKDKNHIPFSSIISTTTVLIILLLGVVGLMLVVVSVDSLRNL